jgi:DNA-binding protein HU-beta
MNKSELITAMAEKAELTKKNADAALTALTETIAEELAKDGSVQLVGFGTFDVTLRAARTAKNLHTGETINVPAKKATRFRAGKSFKDAVNGRAGNPTESKK